jgi:hypothetical protein
MHQDRDGRYSVPTAELYIPWNDTWRLLPDLPAIPNEKKNVTDATIMYLRSDSLGLALGLYLIGGTNVDWSIKPVPETMMTKSVWRLTWWPDIDAYNWTFALSLGECSLLLPIDLLPESWSVLH